MLQHCRFIILEQGFNVVGTLMVEEVVEAFVLGNLLKDLNRRGGTVGGRLRIGGVIEVSVQEIV